MPLNELRRDLSLFAQRHGYIVVLSGDLCPMGLV